MVMLPELATLDVVTLQPANPASGSTWIGVNESEPVVDGERRYER
jgi:hypothetical protein